MALIRQFAIIAGISCLGEGLRLSSETLGVEGTVAFIKDYLKRRGLI